MNAENIRFSFMDKSKAASFLSDLFDMLYTNMNKIAPTENSYEDDKEIWREQDEPTLLFVI